MVAALKVLVTGAGGLLGSDLCRNLRKRHEVTGWTRRAREISGEWVQAMDITDREAVAREMKELKPELVIHTAAVSDVDACERDPESTRRVNVEGVRHLADACRAEGAFLISVSTDYVFNGKAGRPYREEDPTDPVNRYGQMKREAEDLALKLCQRSAVVRVSGLFGSGRPNFVSESVRRGQKEEPIPVTPQRHSPSYTADLAEGFGWLVDRIGSLGKETRILHLCNEGGASRSEVAREILRWLKRPESLVQETTWEALGRPARRPADTRLDGSLFERLTGRRLRPWQQALRDFIDRERGCLS